MNRKFRSAQILQVEDVHPSQENLYQPAASTKAKGDVIFIRRKEVERTTSLSRSRIYDLMKQGKFPKPVRLGPMSVAWVKSEIEKWLNDCIADRAGV